MVASDVEWFLLTYRNPSSSKWLAIQFSETDRAEEPAFFDGLDGEAAEGCCLYRVHFQSSTLIEYFSAVPVTYPPNTRSSRTFPIVLIGLDRWIPAARRPNLGR
jgi:hypothetical protein